MRKKWGVSILAVLMMVSMVSSAGAVPSKTTADMVAVVETRALSGAVLPATFLITPVHNEAAVEAANGELAQVAEFLKDNQAPVVDYFGADAALGVAEKLPEGLRADQLVMNEFISIATLAYDESYGDVEVGFQFATEYADGQFLVVLIGVPGEEGIEWIPLDAYVEEGVVKVAFTADVLARINGLSHVLMAVLSEPIAID